MAEIAGVVLTNNEARNVEACIESLRWADRVVVFDSHSTDETRSLARAAGAEVMMHAFENYSKQRNAALAQVDAAWVFFVDADERVTPELAAEVRRAVEDDRYRGWWVPRHNYIFGRLTMHAGWYPDYQLRLMRRDSARYDPARAVHEIVELDGEAGHLDHPLIHYNYDDLRDFVTRQQRYTEYEARIRYEAGERPRARTYVTQPLRQFWWRFVTLRGFRDGLHGLLLSGLMAYFMLSMWWRVGQMRRREGTGITLNQA